MIGSNTFPGIMDELKIFNYPLLQNNIDDLYELRTSHINPVILYNPNQTISIQGDTFNYIYFNVSGHVEYKLVYSNNLFTWINPENHITITDTN